MPYKLHNDKNIIDNNNNKNDKDNRNTNNSQRYLLQYQRENLTCDVADVQQIGTQSS